MKICYVLDFPVLRVDGPTINELEFLNVLLINKTNEISFFTCKSNEKIFRNNPDSLVYLFDDYKKNRLTYVFFRSISIFINFIYFYLKNKPTIIVTRLGSIPILQLFISIIFRKKLFIKTVGRFWYIDEKLGFKEKIFRKIIFLTNKIILNNSAGIDTVTDKFKNILHNKYHIKPTKKIKIIENSVNTSLFLPKKMKQESLCRISLGSAYPILGYVGNLPSERGAKQLFKLYIKLKEIYPCVAIVIAGDDPGLISLKKIIKEQQMENFFFLGEVPYIEVPSIINQFHIGYSFTTNHDLLEVGNSSQKLRQYISCGKPSITMKGTNSFLNEYDLGSNVDQNNIDEIAEETIKWIKRIEFEGDALSKRLHQYANDHLSTEKIFQQRLEFWQSRLKD